MTEFEGLAIAWAWRRPLVLLLCVGVVQAAPTVSNIRVKHITHSSVYLVWDNVGISGTKRIRTRYGTTTAYEASSLGAIVTAGTGSTGVTEYDSVHAIDGLQAGTEYHFCPQTSDDNGATWSTCVDAIATTLSDPATHPGVPVLPEEIDVANPTQTGSTLAVDGSCTDLQTQIDAAVPGDTITIPAGVTCTGTYALPAAPEIQYFHSGNVQTSTDRITLTSHGFSDTQQVKLDWLTACGPGSAGPDVFCQKRGLKKGDLYKINLVDANTFTLDYTDDTPVSFDALTLGDALATFTADAGADTVTISAISAYYIRDDRTINVESSGTLPAGLSADTTYYVLNDGASQTFQLSLTLNGAAIDITDTGTGTHHFSDPGNTFAGNTFGIIAWPPTSDWIVVRTDTADSAFVPPGVRLDGSVWSAKMATIAKTGTPTGNANDVSLTTGLLTHHWRFIGIDFTQPDNSTLADTSTDPLPWFGYIDIDRGASYILFDRCWIRGLGPPNRIYRAIEKLDGGHVGIINSEFEDLDYWHPYSDSTTGFTMTVNGGDNTIMDVAAGTFQLTPSVAVSLTSADVDLTSGAGSGTALAYFRLDGVLEFRLPSGFTGTCSAAPGTCEVVVDAGSPSYPVDGNGRTGVGQLGSLTIVGGVFTTSALKATDPTSVSNSEGAQSIISGNGPGPFILQNNRFSSTGLPVHFDDSGGWWYDRSDFVVRRNTFTSPLSQIAGYAGSDGLRYKHRNSLEWKAGREILIDGNLFEHNFYDVVPYAPNLVITPRNTDFPPGDITIRNNEFRNTRAAWNIGSIDSASEAAPAIERILVENNLIHHMSPEYKINRVAVQSGINFINSYSTHDLAIRHNTIYDNTGNNAVTTHHTLHAIEGVDWSDNLVMLSGAKYMFELESMTAYCGGSESGKAAMDCMMISGVGTPDYVFTNNLLLPGWTNLAKTTLINPTSVSTAFSGLTNVWVATGATFADRQTFVKFTSATNADAGTDFSLDPTSDYAAGNANDATDGTDIGIDQEALRDAMGTIRAPSAVVLSTTSVRVDVQVPDASVACYVFYGTGADISAHSRTTADTAASTSRAITISGLTPLAMYNYEVFCADATNQPASTFSTGNSGSMTGSITISGGVSF